ncbi:tail fiber protein [Reichenbachiella versicolor]|uniref:tail fiber protein n=1 Tax=Reichenbachiella versicolor TaxID=1821036 RepID=UPI000D6E478A|nr:tail fiber protein [Reichenbachiella versicolor]
MKSTHLFLNMFVLFLTISKVSFAQDGIGIGTSSVEKTAVLDIVSQTKNKGVLLPRLSHKQMWSIISPAEGLLIYNTDEKAVCSYQNGRWSSLGSPTGTIIMWSGTNIPAGWALCDGRWYNPKDHSDIGNSKNGDRNILPPNLKGKFIVGYSSNDVDYNNPGNLSSRTTAKITGKSGGEKSHILTTNEMPSHKHSINSVSHQHSINLSGGSHSHSVKQSHGARFTSDGSGTISGSLPDGVNGPGLVYSQGIDTSIDYEEGYNYSTRTLNNQVNSSTHSHSGTTNNNTHTHSIGNSGNGSAHENRPPYYTLAYLMKL